MRDIFKIIDAIIALIPKNKENVVDELEWLKNDSAYKAPEQMQGQWAALCNILNDNLNSPPEHGMITQSSERA